MSKSEREPIVTQSLNIITEYEITDMESKLLIMSAIDGIQSADREDVIKQSQRLITKGMSAEEILKVIHNVERVSTPYERF